MNISSEQTDIYNDVNNEQQIGNVGKEPTKVWNKEVQLSNIGQIDCLKKIIKLSQNGILLIHTLLSEIFSLFSFLEHYKLPYPSILGGKGSVIRCYC